MIKIIKEEVQKQQWNKAEGQFLYMDETAFMNKGGRDADNLKKLTQDSITESGVVWTDDTYCLPRTQKILIDKYNPRIELDISMVDYIGIFKDNEEYQTFLDTYCNKCYKDNNKCTLIRDCLEGRINLNIVNDDNLCLKCLKYRVKKK